jgi:hypothetical protein
VGRIIPGHQGANPMSSTISIIAHTIWSWFPNLIGLWFTTALIRFYPTVALMIHRLRHGMRRCGSHHPWRSQRKNTRTSSSRPDDASDTSAEPTPTKP